MLEREAIIAELWSKLSSVDTVVTTSRNSKVPPAIGDLPSIAFFELADTVEKVSSRGASQKPSYRRRFKVVIESYISASSEGAATKELGLFIRKVKQQLYEDGQTLGGLAAFKEVETSRIFRPPVGEHVIGVGFVIEIVYIEDIGALF